MPPDASVPLRRDQPTPARIAYAELTKPPADADQALTESFATLAAVAAYAAAKRGASLRAKSPEEALRLVRSALQHIEEECDSAAARVAQFVTDPGGQS